MKLQEEQDGLLKEQEALEDRLKRLEETNLELKVIWGEGVIYH